MSYIDGLATGLNTSEIIKALMEVERIPKVLIEQRRSAVQAGIDAFASIRTKVSAIRAAADAISTPNAWRALSGKSSNTDAVEITAGTGSATGALTFTVVNLARAMSQTSGDMFAGKTASLEGRTVEIAAGDHTFSSTATTLDQLVAEINADDALAVRASTIQVAPGLYQLVLKSEATGVAQEFSAVGTGWTDPFAVTVEAADAVLEVDGIVVTRSSNTITDLLDHATITLRAATTAPVTVMVDRDVEGLVSKVEELVNALNSAKAEIKLRTGFDPELNRRSALTGDSAARALTQALTDAVVGLTGGSGGSLALVGIELKRDGSFALDAGKLEKALADDPDSVLRLFSADVTASAGVTFVNAGWRAQPGSHSIELSQIDGQWSARIGGVDATVTQVADGSLRIAVPALNDTLGGMTVTVDAATAATATGSFEVVGTVDYQPGVARRLSATANRALDSINGTLTTAEAARRARVVDLNRQIDAFEIRLEKRELRLRQQYTALESIMGQLGNQATWLSGQIAGLQSNAGIR